MSYTGAPLSLLTICRCLKAENNAVSVWSASSGPLEKEFLKQGIKVLIVSEKDLKKKSVISAVRQFDLIICNTIVCDAYYRTCSKYVPTIWYIHEAAMADDYIRANIDRAATIRHCKHLVCVSEYAKTCLAHYTKQNIGILHNFIEDQKQEKQIMKTNDAVRFIQMGSITPLKAYDVLLNAFLSMPDVYMERAELQIAGKYDEANSEYCENIKNLISLNNRIKYVGMIEDVEKKNDFIAQSDVVVVASKDESCSLVALEGAMMSKPLIVTDCVGAKYIVNQKNGIIVESSSVSSLMKSMMNMIDRREELKEMGEASRKQFEKYADSRLLKKELNDMIKSISRSFVETIINRIIYGMPGYLYIHGRSYLLRKLLNERRTS